MEIIDLHCDVLSKLTNGENIDFRKDPRLHSSLVNLQTGNVKIQVFAIYIDPNIPQNQKFIEAARQIEAFHKKVLAEPEMVHIKDWYQLHDLREGQIGAILSLEGCDCIGEDLEKLKVILNAGVKIVGLTWNYENAIAFGALEDPDKGLKPFAYEVIRLLNDREIIIDVAHLNERGFYELIPFAKNIIASHCNARALCNHPRNLSDDQIKRLVQSGGRIHVVFYPPFIEKNKKKTTIDKLVEHVDYIASLIGVENVGFGSDFDGIDPLFVENLSSASEYQNFIKALNKKFSNDDILTMASKGFRNYILNFSQRK